MHNSHSPTWTGVRVMRKRYGTNKPVSEDGIDYHISVLYLTPRNRQFIDSSAQRCSAFDYDPISFSKQNKLEMIFVNV